MNSDLPPRLPYCVCGHSRWSHVVRGDADYRVRSTEPRCGVWTSKDGKCQCREYMPDSGGEAA